LLWQISKQLEALTGIMYNRGNPTTTTTTTIVQTTTTTSTTIAVTTTTTSTSAPTTTTTTTAVPTPFLMTLNVVNPGTTVTLPYGGSATYTGTIDWGDATITANSFATKQHTYANAGVYQIEIDGTVGFWNAGYYSSPIPRLVSIDQFGNQFSFGDDVGTYFAGLAGLVSVASDIPLTGINNMYAMFSGCSNFNQDISGWNVSAVTEMTGMFANAINFNQDLSSWCVTNIPTQPTNFDQGATSWVLPKPVWGTCP
jgi:surface protein